MPCYFCDRSTDELCSGCGFAICADCDNEVISDESPHDPEAHLDLDDDGYEDVSDEEAE